MNRLFIHFQISTCSTNFKNVNKNNGTRFHVQYLFLFWYQKRARYIVMCMDNNFQNTNTSFHVPFSKATDWHAKKKHMKVFRPWWQYANIIRDPVSSFLLFQCVIIFVPSNAMSNNSFLQKILSCCFYNEYETKNINMKIGKEID